MKNLRSLLALIFVMTTTLSFAKEKPYLIIEDNGDNFEVFLKIDNMEDVSAVHILGDYRVDDLRTAISLSFDDENVNLFKDKIALIHELEKCCSFASYTILVTDIKGKVSGYPMVNVDLSTLASN